MKNLIQVSKEEFNRFLNEYQRPLTSGMTMICEPPFRSYRDESIYSSGNVGTAEYYFDKEVARLSYERLGPNGEVDKENDGRFWEYFIRRQAA